MLLAGVLQPGVYELDRGLYVRNVGDGKQRRVVFAGFLDVNRVLRFDLNRFGFAGIVEFQFEQHGVYSAPFALDYIAYLDDIVGFGFVGGPGIYILGRVFGFCLG